MHGYFSAKFSFSPRSALKFYIKECGRENWEKFSVHHYLSGNLNRNSKCYGCYNEQNEIIGFCAFIYYPHPKVKIRKVHRIVILPDYQGCGIGKKFLTEVTKIEQNKNPYHRINISTSSFFFAKGLEKSPEWKITHKKFYSTQKGSITLLSRKTIIYTVEFKKNGIFKTKRNS
ncbi:MAG: GNAT family N-acetyltransferase [Bacteroidales bacterium]|nr:GNAT family N-acetyltransferase [Bacteroidales bacterium]